MQECSVSARSLFAIIIYSIVFMETANNLKIFSYGKAIKQVEDPLYMEVTNRNNNF